MVSVTDYCAAGTRLTYVASWDTTASQYLLASVSDSEVAANVANDLNVNQNIVVESTQINRPLASGTLSITLGLLVNGDHAHVDDVRQIVDHSFYVASSSSAPFNGLPSASRITTVQAPGIVSTPEATGAPAAPPNDSTGDATTANMSGLSDFLPTSGSVALIAGIVVIGLLAIAFTASRV